MKETFVINASLYFKIAALLYALGLAADLLNGKTRRPVLFFLILALGANGMAAFLRYRSAWPMMPMYLGPVLLPLGLGLLALWVRGTGKPTEARRWMLALALTAAVLAVLFPKDFYLPFIKSGCLPAHLFLLFSATGRACLLAGAAWAFTGLGRGPAGALGRSMGWTVWGFFFCTLSMFCGEFWAYLGWGVPVVWDDPAVLTAMAVWFYYICLLHLHLTGAWSVRGRTAYAAFGAVMVFALNLVPELGPFQWPL